MVLYAITQVLIIEKILLILTGRNLEKVQFRLDLLHEFDRYCESSFKCVGIEFRFRSTSTASNSFCIYISLLTRVNSQILKELMEFNSGGILILPVKLSIYVLSVQSDHRISLVRWSLHRYKCLWGVGGQGSRFKSPGGSFTHIYT